MTAPPVQVVPEPLPPRAKVGYLRLLRDLRKLTTVYDELRDETGPVALVVLGPKALLSPIVVVTSPSGARQVLGGHDGTFDKQALLHDEVRKLVGLNLFSVAYGAWKPRRRMLQPLFTPKHVASYADHMTEAANALGRRWEATSGTLDLDHEMRRLTLRVLGRSLFGRSLDDDALEMAPHVERTLRYITNRSLQPVRAPDWLPTPARRRARASRDALRASIAKAVAQRADARAGDGELIAFLIAGHDTTATTLTAALWLLGWHPDVQQRVADEVAAAGEALSVTDLPKLPLTNRVVQEAMRLYPPAAAVIRKASKDTSLGGYRVPAGNDVVVSIWALHHDPGLWPEPHRFDPDRFLPEKVNERDRWAYLPFGGGPRACLGDHFAFAEATMGLANLVRRFHVESVDHALPLTAPFTLTVRGPIPARIRARS